MNLRSIEIDDLDDLAQLFQACFSVPPWNEKWTFELARSRIARMLECRSCRGVLATEGDSVVGMAFGQVEGWIDGNLFLLQELCVLSKHRGQGIGKVMLNKLVSDLRSNDGLIALYLLTDRGGPAESFYQKLGFACSGQKIVMGLPV
ncbi:MAG: family acetyltransferase [Proteobacteria bacterium]|nr:family acetyltransferase [Pseudomonadota bacterium]